MIENGKMLMETVPHLNGMSASDITHFLREYGGSMSKGLTDAMTLAFQKGGEIIGNQKYKEGLRRATVRDSIAALVLLPAVFGAGILYDRMNRAEEYKERVTEDKGVSMPKEDVDAPQNISQKAPNDADSPDQDGKEET